ncbi:hypothetical protein Bhyg_08648, partial [Pseudolycoriella hygida]
TNLQSPQKVQRLLSVLRSRAITHITRNVADALDVLQGEIYMYQEVFSPIIDKMKQKINYLSHLRFCEPLKRRFLKSMEEK